MSGDSIKLREPTIAGWEQQIAALNALSMADKFVTEQKRAEQAEARLSEAMAHIEELLRDTHSQWMETPRITAAMTFISSTAPPLTETTEAEACRPQTGVWFNDEHVWMQRKPCVVQWTKQTPEHLLEPMEVIGCPGCTMGHMRDMHPGQKVKRWMLLPP